REKTIGRRWCRSEGKGRRSEVRQEFGNDGEQNKSNVTLHEYERCAVLQLHTGTHFRDLLFPENITCPPACVSVGERWELG
ncbi:G-protein coupled receptor-associated protein LMBRD2, partial [Dissostichus eleginoides]